MGPFDWGACLPFFLVAAAAQSIICPPLGPILPPPKGKLSNHALIKSLSQNLTETLDILFHPSNATSRFHQFQANLTSISLEVVSTSDQDPLFAYYHTANLLNSTGTQLVTDRTIFRIGSITKLFTVLALILHEDKFSWQDSITKHVPELLDSESFKMSNQGQLDSVLRTQWQNITLEQLASHLSGMPRDSKLYFPYQKSSETDHCCKSWISLPRFNCLGRTLAFPPSIGPTCQDAAPTSPVGHVRDRVFNLELHAIAAKKLNIGRIRRCNYPTHCSL